MLSFWHFHVAQNNFTAACFLCLFIDVHETRWFVLVFLFLLFHSRIFHRLILTKKKLLFLCFYRPFLFHFVQIVYMHEYVFMVIIFFSKFSLDDIIIRRSHLCVVCI